MELLIVIVILGVLAGVVVFAVGGIAGSGEDSAAAADERTLVTAQESYRAVHGTYTSEDGLVTAGFLRNPSEIHDIDVSSDGRSYTVAQAAPNGGSTTPATTVPAPETTSPATTLAPVAFSYAGFSGRSTGTGSRTLVIIGRNGGGSTDALYAMLTSTPLADTRVVWLDGSDINDTGDVQAVVDADPDYMIAADSVPISIVGGGSTFVGQYMSTFLSSPSQFWWTHDLGNPSLAQLEARVS